MQKDRILKKILEIEKILGIKFDDDIILTSKIYPILVSEYYLNLIDKRNPFSDPIFKQCIPSKLEILPSDYDEDPQDEKRYEVVPKLIHRYQDRALILTTNKCSTLCRFCFRKRYWKTGNSQKDLTDSELVKIVSYIEEHPDIKEILLSGGDFLMLPYRQIKLILETISKIKTVDAIRIASRVPVVMPGLITKGVVNLISEFDKVWILTHFNHPKEVTDKSMKICRAFIKKGIPIFNQSVLIKGVNNDKNILKELFQLLVKNKIKPLYLFHIDPVKGTTHFATGIDNGLEILRELRGELSSLAMPTFCIDLPGGGGKLALQPSYSDDGIYFKIDGRKIKYYSQTKIE